MAIFFGSFLSKAISIQGENSGENVEPPYTVVYEEEAMEVDLAFPGASGGKMETHQ